MNMQVLKPGLLTTVQDAGRQGLARLGIGRSGAMDRPACALANALVCNDVAAPAFEITLRGPVLQFERAAIIAVTGAAIDIRIEGVSLPRWRPLSLPAGSVLHLGGMASGARSYLAIAGGVQAPIFMGSASVDLHAGIGAAVNAGDVFALADVPACAWSRDGAIVSWPSWSAAPAHWFDPASRPLRFFAGRHFDALDPVSRQRLLEQEFVISNDSNRVGYRLQGSTLALSAAVEMVSEAVDFGCMQLPPGGDPIVLMAEHPTTGGYPRIAQIAAVDLPWLAQQAPGARVRFERIDSADAHLRLQRQALMLDAVVAEIGRRWQARR